MSKIEDNATILFQGDSITDCNRNTTDPNDLGQGYPSLVATWFSALYPEKQVTFINKGLSGNRCSDLLSRWEPDCIDLKPTWVSILIGINDTWRRYDSGDPTSTEAFEKNYRLILEMTRQRLNAHLILCEPFLLPSLEDRRAWREDLDPKIQVVRALAREYRAIYVPLDGMFAAAAAHRDMNYWLPDGVHPSPVGHALISQAWLEAVGVR